MFRIATIRRLTGDADKLTFIRLALLACVCVTVFTQRITRLMIAKWQIQVSEKQLYFIFVMFVKITMLFIRGAVLTCACVPVSTWQLARLIFAMWPHLLLKHTHRSPARQSQAVPR